jgi:hypothetical protein
VPAAHYIFFKNVTKQKIKESEMLNGAEKVIVVIAPTSFRGEKKLKKNGGKVFHSSSETGVADTYTTIIKAGKAKVLVVDKVSDQTLNRFVEKALEFKNEVHTGLTVNQLLKMLK